MSAIALLMGCGNALTHDAGVDGEGSRDNLDAALDALDSTVDASVPDPTDATVDDDRSTGDENDSTSPSVDAGAVVCPLACPKGQKYCHDICVAIDDPKYGCGTNTCFSYLPYAPTEHVAEVMCAGGKLAVKLCLPGTADCDGFASNGCEADLSSPQTCGNCQTACGANQVCDGNVCANSCTPPKTNCGGACHDLSTDPVACGTCSTSCDSAHGTASCSTGKCGVVCNQGFTPCPTAQGVACTNLLELSRPPPLFCGGCNTTCAVPAYGETMACSNSQCVSGCVLGFSSCGGVCVDKDSDPVNCGACGFGCANGQVCVAGSCVAPTVLKVVSGLGAPEDIAVDAQNIYYTDLGTNEVWQVDKLSFVATRLAFGQARPYRLAVDSTYVYWTSNLGNAIVRVPIGGGSPSVLYSPTAPTALAVDSNFIYWSDGTGFAYRAPRSSDAGPPTQLTLVTHIDEFKQDAAWLYGWSLTPSMIFAIDKSNGATLVADSDVAETTVRGIAIDSTTIYWEQSWRGQPNLVSGMKVGGVRTGWRVPSEPRYIEADECTEYWTDGGISVWKLVHGMSTPRRLTVGATASNRLAVDDKYVYWTDAGWIGRVPK